MSPADELLTRLAPFVEWVVFRFRRIVLTTIAIIFCWIFLSWAWSVRAAVGTSPVEGRVTVAGRPVTFGTVTILTADGTTLTTPIQPDGTYLLPHVPPGPVQIAVSSPDPKTVFEKALSDPVIKPPKDPAATANGGINGQPSPGKKTDAGGNVTIAARVDKPPPSTQAQARPEHAGWFRIPGRYASPAQSGLKTTVEPRGSTVNLDLEGVTHRPSDHR